MINYLIIALLWAAIILSVVSVAAEMICRRNSESYHFFRAIWIRLRGFSPLSFAVTSILLLFWGLVSGDDNFCGIWMSIAMMLAILVVVHPEDLFSFKKRRKRSRRKKQLRPLAGYLPILTKESPLAAESAILTPLSAEKEQPKPDSAS